MSKASVLLPALLIASAAGVIYIYAGTNASNKIEKLQLVGFKAKLKKSTVLEWKMELQPFFVNPSNEALTFQSFKGKVFYREQEFSKIDFEKNVTIPNDGKPHDIPGINSSVQGLQVINALLTDKKEGKADSLLVKGTIKVDGLPFPVNYEIPIKKA